MKPLQILLVTLFLAGVAAAQTPNVPQTVTAQEATCASTPYLIECVSTVNGKPVCPYGRVAWGQITPAGLPGQPYTVFTYPTKDPEGNLIDFTKCVWTLPSAGPKNTKLGFHF